MESTNDALRLVARSNELLKNLHLPETENTQIQEVIILLNEAIEKLSST